MKTKNKFNRRYIIILAVLSVLVLSLAVYAWFYNTRSIYTYSKIDSPSTLAIKGPNETAIQEIKLDNVDLFSETKTAYFIFCVTGKSVNQYMMELSYTTNVNFTYSILETTQSTTSTPGALTSNVDGIDYYYPVDGTAVSGSFINKDASTQIADTSKHADAYKTYGNVQKNAEPLYYFMCGSDGTSGIDVRNKDVNGNFADYYILKLTWTDQDVSAAPKETDLVYVLAASK